MQSKRRHAGYFTEDQDERIKQVESGANESKVLKIQGWRVWTMDLLDTYLLYEQYPHLQERFHYSCEP